MATASQNNSSTWITAWAFGAFVAANMATVAAVAAAVAPVAANGPIFASCRVRLGHLANESSVFDIVWVLRLPIPAGPLRQISVMGENNALVYVIDASAFQPDGRQIPVVDLLLNQAAQISLELRQLESVR